MPLSLSDMMSALPVYGLVLFRVSGLILTAPLYGSRMIPRRIRVALAITLAAVIFPFVRSQAPAEISLSMAVAGGVGEIMIGATIGLALSILLIAGEVAGLIVGRQAGLALAEVFDPNENRQASIVGQVYTITFTLVFLLVGGHRAAVSALLDTFHVIPLLSFRLDETFISLLVEMLAAAFLLGIRLAAPVLICLFLVGTALAFLSRTMPQLNILTVGFTVRLLLALAVAALAIAACEDLLVDAVWDGVEMIRVAFHLGPMTGLTN